MDSVAFVAVAAMLAWKKKKKRKLEETSTSHPTTDILVVDQDNHPLDSKSTSNNDTPHWYRATFLLIMYEPPHLFYEPREWSETTVLMLDDKILSLPGGTVSLHDTYEGSAIQYLKQNHKIDVCAPQNCLHHLFTFPMKFDAPDENGFAGVWGDFYECVARGAIPELDDHHTPLTSYSLAKLKQMVDDDKMKSGSNHPEEDQHTTIRTSFAPETLYALKLYFQRQGDLRAKRRLLKGYSSTDLEKYGLRHSSSSLEKLVLTDLKDTQRQQAIDYTMKCDDGMSPSLLYKADVVLLGVSRAGKTPMSIFMAQTMGLKVANIPLVMELPPPKQLEKVNPRKVFCLTLQPEYLADFRRSRFEREMKKSMKRSSGYSNLGLGGSSLGLGGSSSSIGSTGSCSYADSSYVQRDLDNARSLARTHGYTEIDVTGRAMEETSSLILSKLRERFPDQSCYHGI